MTSKPALAISVTLWLFGVLILLLSISFAVSVGAVSIPITHVWGIIGERLQLTDVTPFWSRGQAAIVWQVRLPRALLAALVGSGLAVVGCALQSVTRNPLADPHLLGISSGAAFGAVLAMLHTGLFLGLFTVPIFAFCGSMLAATMVFLLFHYGQQNSANHLILIGVAVSFILMGMANGLIFLGDPRASHTAIFWMLGGLGLATWQNLIGPALLLVCAGCWLRLMARPLNAMMIGDETALTLGISPKRTRLQVFLVSALLTSMMVAFSGTIGFVGLMVPHIARLLIGSNNERLVPASILFGAIFLVWADILARTLIQPEDLPIGIITGFIGGLFFLWLMNRRAPSL